MRWTGRWKLADDVTSLDVPSGLSTVTKVLVWTASHPHGSMALSASQLDERKV
jgi:proteasome lid subunit RPN8/RPN11